MSPDLLATLGHLSLLNAAELALVGATAATLAAQSVASVSQQPAPSPPPFLRSPSAIQQPPVGQRSSVSSVPAERTPRSMFLGTTTQRFCDRVDPDLFASATYQARRGATVPSLLYLAGNRVGLTALAELIGLSVYKAGVTGAESASLRMANLAASRYGSCVRQGGRWVEQPGFQYFEAAVLPLQHRRGPLSPVRNAMRAIAFDRPVSLSLGVMDTAVRDGLAAISLAEFAQSPDGQALCAARGIDPAVLDRYTPAITGRSSRARPQQASELVIGLGPRAAAEPLADLLEKIIADHVMAQRP